MWTGKPSQLKYSHNNYLTHDHAVIPRASGTWERRTISFRKYFKPMYYHFPHPRTWDCLFVLHARQMHSSNELRKSQRHQRNINILSTPMTSEQKSESSLLNTAMLQHWKSSKLSYQIWKKVRCGCSKNATTTSYMFLPDDTVTAIPCKKRGRPLTLDDFDQDVQNFIRGMRKAGSPINTTCILAAAQGIVVSKDCTLLVEHRGHIKLTKSWAASLMQRMKLVKRQGSTQMKTALTEALFLEVKGEFLSTLRSVVLKNKVVPQMIVNWDQTGINVVPASTWTMAEKGSSRVPIAGLGDKRQITVTVAITMSGQMLPLQIFYTGKTERCHPSYSFPEGFDIWHTPNHWTNSDTTIIKFVIVPYVSSVWERMELRPDYPAVVLYDAFKGHKKG